MTRSLSRRHLLLAASAALLLPGRLRAEELRDASGVPVVAREARRILSLGPDITEILDRIGAGDLIVARDQSSRYPSKMEALPSVGHRRKLSPEGVMSVEADLILAADDIGPPEVVEFLKSRGQAFVTVPHRYSREGILEKIAIVAGTLGRVAEGEALGEEVSRDYLAAEDMIRDMADAARRRVVFLHGLLNLSAAGRDTSAGEILRAAGAANILADHEGWLSAAPEVILERDPEVVVMMPSSAGGPTPEEVFAHPGLRETTAARNGALILLDDNLMIGFGPRTAGQIRRLALALYPELAGEAAPG